MDEPPIDKIADEFLGLLITRMITVFSTQYASTDVVPQYSKIAAENCPETEHNRRKSVGRWRGFWKSESKSPM